MNYFVAKTRDGAGFVGSHNLEEISKQWRDGKIAGDYVATRSCGPSYSELLKLGTPNWITVADLVDNWTAHNTRENDSVGTGTKSSSCSKCSAPLDGDSKFCPSCAAPVLSHIARHCPNCFKPVDGGARFCKNCATDLTPKSEFAPKKPSGIGGWLIIPAIGMLISPILIVGGLLQNITILRESIGALELDYPGAHTAVLAGR